MSLHQAAQALSIDRKNLETSLKNAVGFGEMVSLARNRFVPAWYVARLARAAEQLAAETAEGLFTAAGYCERTGVGRNFAIDLLEYFDRQGFTARVDNNRRIRRPAAAVFGIENE